MELYVCPTLRQPPPPKYPMCCCLFSPKIFPSSFVNICSEIANDILMISRADDGQIPTSRLDRNPRVPDHQARRRKLRIPSAIAIGVWIQMNHDTKENEPLKIESGTQDKNALFHPYSCFWRFSIGIVHACLRPIPSIPLCWLVLTFWLVIIHIKPASAIPCKKQSTMVLLMAHVACMGFMGWLHGLVPPLESPTPHRPWLGKGQKQHLWTIEWEFLVIGGRNQPFLWFHEIEWRYNGFTCDVLRFNEKH